jgi:hypothetical protein
MKIKNYLQKLRIAIDNKSKSESQLLMLGKLLSETVNPKKSWEKKNVVVKVNKTRPNN